jgi:hypothetical protein
MVRPVARRRLVETENPSACAKVDCKVCGIAIALYVSVITSGCNQSAYKIQSSEIEPVIYVTCTTLHATIYRVAEKSVNRKHYLVLTGL